MYSADAASEASLDDQRLAEYGMGQGDRMKRVILTSSSAAWRLRSIRYCLSKDNSSSSLDSTTMMQSWRVRKTARQAAGTTQLPRSKKRRTVPAEAMLAAAASTRDAMFLTCRETRATCRKTSAGRISYCSSVPGSWGDLGSSGGMTTAAATLSPASRLSSLTPDVLRPADRIVLVSMRMILPN